MPEALATRSHKVPFEAVHAQPNNVPVIFDPSEMRHYIASLVFPHGETFQFIERQRVKEVRGIHLVDGTLTIDTAALAPLVASEQHLAFAEKMVKNMAGYLFEEAIGDVFGNNEARRTEWEEDMAIKHPTLFYEGYYRHNQFRRNRIGVVETNFTTLIGIIEAGGKDPDMVSYLKDTYEHLETHKENYNKKTIEEKLAVIRDYEDRIIEVFDRLFATSSHKEILLVT